MDKKMGVFSPCENMDSASMIKCLQALLKDYPSIKFSSITTDKKNNGFKIMFTEPEDSKVLEKNMLLSEDQPIWIYPLTTYVFISNVNHKKSPLFERDLRDAIGRKFGRVLSVLKTANSPQSKNWRIEIEIPEFKGSEAFKNSDFSEIKLSIPCRDEEIVLKFWCRECDMFGHFQHECPIREAKANNTRSKLKADENTSNFSEMSNSSSDRNSDTTYKQDSNFSLETTERYAEKIGREEVMSKIQKNTNNNKERNINNSLLMEKDIKKEKIEFPQGTDTKEDKNLGKSKPEIPENNWNSQDINNETEGLVSETRYSTDGDDDEIRILDFTDNSANKSPSNYSATAETRSTYEEESRSSPETKNVFNNLNFPFLETAGPSQESQFTPLKTPRGAEVTTALSERLQDCINQVCANFKVLDRKKLDAFLIHVKKKSNPIRVALNYTANTKGLKDQLQGILHMYYNTPQTGTKEDIQFIKWLNGLVERYDGSIPKKRKRSGKTDDDDPPAKR